jgi:hypothetical protein
MECLKRLGISLFVVLCVTACECNAQATFYVFNESHQGVQFYWASDYFPLEFTTIVGNPPAPTVLRVPVRPSGSLTNFIVVAEILTGTRKIPGASFTAIDGERLFIRIIDDDPGYHIEVTHPRYYEDLLGKDIYEQWTKSLNERAEKAKTTYDATKKQEK